jgi:hypothetical protein
VVAHVISYDDLGARDLLMLAAQDRFHRGRIHAAALRRYDTRSPGGCPRRWAAESGWPRRSSTTRTSGAGSHGCATDLLAVGLDSAISSTPKTDGA